MGTRDRGLVQEKSMGQGPVIAMKRIPVNSTNLASVGYSKAQKILEVEFIDGSVYQYIDVPQAIYESLLGSSSRGHYLHVHVKGIYKFSQVS
jgi:hypothetical protein